MALLFEGINLKSKEIIEEFWNVLSHEIPASYHGKKLFIFGIQRDYNGENAVKLKGSHSKSQLFNLPPIEKVKKSTMEKWIDSACAVHVKPHLDKELNEVRIGNMLEQGVEYVVRTICTIFSFSPDFLTKSPKS